MNDFIKRSALLEKLRERDLCLCVTEWDIRELPAEDVAPVRHGRYKKSGFFDEWYDSYFVCMECGARFMIYDGNDEPVPPKCCPVCTARMDGDTNA